VQGLLNDPEPVVRLRAAQGLLAARDRSGVPTLIGLLADGPHDLAVRVREQLMCLAGNRSPQAPLGPDPDQEPDEKRRKAAVRAHDSCRKAWNLWWASNRTMDLSKVDVELPPLNPSLQALQVAWTYVNAVEKADLALLKQVTGVPFLEEGRAVVATREELDRMLDDTGMGTPGIPFSNTFIALRQREELLRSATVPLVRTFLNGIPREELRGVEMRTQVPGAGEVQQTLFVRVKNGQAKVVGRLQAQGVSGRT
jgi:hypothetical protein